MANQKISARTLATSLTGTEKIPIGVSGDKATTPDQLKDYVDAPTSLDELTDVEITTPTTGQVLTYDGSDWVNDDATGGGFPVSDAEFEVFNDTDPTKLLHLDLSDITTGTTRTLTSPNASGTIALTSDLNGWLTGTLTGNTLVNPATFTFEIADVTDGNGIKVSTTSVSNKIESLPYETIESEETLVVQQSYDGMTGKYIAQFSNVLGDGLRVFVLRLLEVEFPVYSVQEIYSEILVEDTDPVELPLDIFFDPIGVLVVPADGDIKLASYYLFSGPDTTPAPVSVVDPTPSYVEEGVAFHLPELSYIFGSLTTYNNNGLNHTFVGEVITGRLTVNDFNYTGDDFLVNDFLALGDEIPFLIQGGGEIGVINFKIETTATSTDEGYVTISTTGTVADLVLEPSTDLVLNPTGDLTIPDLAADTGETWALVIDDDGVVTSQPSSGGASAADQNETNAGTEAGKYVAPSTHAGYHRRGRQVTGTDDIVQTDQDGIIWFNSATPFNFTIDELLINTQVGFVNIGDGEVTFVNGSGVTISGVTSLAGGENASAVIFYKSATAPVILSGGGSSGTFVETVTGDIVDNTDPQNPVVDVGPIFDSFSNALKWKDSVKAATTANITLSGEQTIDGVALVELETCLVKDQDDDEDNGIYEVRSGSWVRTTNADSVAEITAAVVMVEQGAVNASKIFKQVEVPTTLGTDPITWEEVGGSTGLTESQVIDLILQYSPSMGNFNNL